MGTRCLQRCWEPAAFLMLLVKYAVFLLSSVSLYPGLLRRDFVSLSRTFIKGELVVVEAARPSLHSSVFVLLLARSDWFRVVKFTPQIGFVSCAFHVTCVLKNNLTSVAFLPFHKITLENKKRETSMILFWFSPDFNYS